MHRFSPILEGRWECWGHPDKEFHAEPQYFVVGLANQFLFFPYFASQPFARCPFTAGLVERR